MTRVPRVYRLYDAAGTLLYVGMTHNFQQRLRDHRGKPWGSGIVWWSWTEYATRSEAAAAEKKAIRSEKPKHNIIYNQEAEGPMRWINVTLPGELHKGLKVQAARSGVSLRSLIIRYLREGTSK